MKVWKAVCAALLIPAIVCMSGCGGAGTELPDNAAGSSDYDYTDKAFDERIKQTSGWALVASDSGLELYVNGRTTEAAVKNTETGKWWYTNPADRVKPLPDPGSDEALIASQFLITYMDDKDKPVEKTSFSDCVTFGQFDFVPLKGGIRVNYLVNKVEKRYLVPPVISQQRFEEFIAKLPESEAEMLNGYYTLKTSEGMTPEGRIWQESLFPALRHGNIYVLSSGYNYTTGVSTSDLMLQMIEPYFVMAGYTESDLKLDREMNTVEGKTPPDYSVRLSVEYVLDAGELVARIPHGSIRYNAKALKLLELSFLPFFGAAGKDADGYIMVPDGSGALIHLNNGKTSITPYKKQVYGRDRSLEPERLEPGDGSQIHLPVYGLKDGDKAFLAIIEKGDAAAWLNADTGGKLSAYNHVYSAFTLIESGIETNAILNQTGSQIYQKQPLSSDLQLRVLLLQGARADYTGMARAYQDYLLRTGQLKERTDAAGEMPFALNLIGAVTYNSTFLGFPKKTEKALTGYSQARDIVEELRSHGVSGIRLTYTGWMNGGVNHTSPGKLKLIGKLGGNKDFRTLVDYTAQNGIAFYPDVDFSYVPRDVMWDGFSENAHAAHNLSGAVAYDYSFNRSTLMRDKNSHRVIVSPKSYGNLTQSFLSAYGSYGISGLSVSLAGTDLNADYQEAGLCDRQESCAQIARQLAGIADKGYQVAVSGANVYTLASASFVNDVPIQSGNHYLFDQTVPFYQIVIHGVLPYAGSPLNMTDDIKASVLRYIEYGTAPAFRWIYEDNMALKETDFNYYSVDYKLWTNDALTAYRTMKDPLTACAGGKIDSHVRLAAGVYKTVYDNGTVIYVNHNREPAEADGFRLEAESVHTAEGGV